MKPNTFDVARMEALKAYAMLEHELCLLLKAIIPVEAPIASTIFYSISATRTRYAIINSILEINYPDTFAKAWPKLEKWLIPRDTARNHIIHWGQNMHVIVQPMSGRAMAEVDKGALVTVRHDDKLTNTARRWRLKTGNEKVYAEKDIHGETAAIKTMEMIIRRYNSAIYFPERWPWTDKFQQPISDQTPEGFLSRLNDAERPAPPQPSPQ